MKNKKIILSLAFPLLISCGQNNHDFSIKWENDENYHWHVCQIEGHNDTSKKEKHMWDNGKVIKEPSKTETGTMKYVCTTCLKEKTETIDKLKEQTTYTITFDSRGGSEVKSITAEAGTKIDAPKKPTKKKEKKPMITSSLFSFEKIVCVVRRTNLNRKKNVINVIAIRVL